MKKLIRFALLSLAFVLSGTAFGQMPGQPANSWVNNAEWYCNDGYKKSGKQCVSIFSEMPNGTRPANSWVNNAEWYCNDGYKKSGNQCVSIFSEMPNGKKPANSWVNNAEWYCNDGYKKSGNQCVSIFSEMPNGKKPANSWVNNAEWYCNDGYKKSGNQCVSIFGTNNKDQNLSEFTAPKSSSPSLPTPTNCPGADVSRWTNCTGEITLKDKHSYKGEFLNGKMHGYGVMNILHPNFKGDKYVGEFNENKKNGQGTYIFAQGNKYVGSYKDDEYHGLGTFTYVNGNKYIGEFKEGEMHGQGTFTFANGDKYVGEYKDSKYNGQGTYTYENGNKYVGEFKDGKLNGQGTFEYASGGKYVGELKDDKFNGRGILYSANGTIEKSGTYRDDQLVTSQFIDPNSFTRIAGHSTSAAVSDAQRIEADRQRGELEKERQRLAEEKRKFEVEKTLRDQEIRQVAEDRRRLDAQKAQIEQEKKSSRIAIKSSASQPDANGDFTITIQTGADTASLKIDGDELGGKRDGNYVIKRVARVGEDNSYKITARDVFGNTDSATVTVARQVADSRPAIPRLNPANVRVQQSRDAVAIIIGIENYRRVAKADFANADAKEFYTYASRALGIKPENIKLLVDDGADLSDVLDAFQNWLPLKVNKGKTDVYVFYSGHGYPIQDGKGLYFLPFNVDSKILDRTSVKQKEIVSALQKAQAKSVTMFIDACYSGQTRNGEVLVAGIKPVFITTEERAYPPEFTVITASAADQFSSASHDLKHGIFSFYLMKALEGDADENKDGRITSGELQRYLSDMVGRQAMGMNRTQNTQLFGDADRVLMTR